MQIAPFLPLILLSASIAIYGETAHRRRIVYAFKPLTTLLVIALAAGLPAGDPSYRLAILVGLLLSLVGDVLLMLPGDRFLPGLVAFLLAQLAYLAAFTLHVPFAATMWPFLAVALAASAVVSILWGGVPRRMRPPVLAYVVAIGAMAAQAIVQGTTLRILPAWAGALGAALFFTSDAVLAFNRFRRPFRGDRIVVLASYWSAQVLIAISVLIPTG